MSEEEPHQPQGPVRSAGRLEKEEARLWRIALLFLVLLATALAAVSWEPLRTLPYHLGLIPISLLFVAIFFAAFTYGRRKQVAELKGLLHNLQEKVSNPTEDQLDQ